DPGFRQPSVSSARRHDRNPRSIQGHTALLGGLPEKMSNCGLLMGKLLNDGKSGDFYCSLCMWGRLRGISLGYEAWRTCSVSFENLGLSSWNRIVSMRNPEFSQSV